MDIIEPLCDENFAISSNDGSNNIDKHVQR